MPQTAEPNCSLSELPIFVYNTTSFAKMLVGDLLKLERGGQEILPKSLRRAKL